eukprot:GEMP01070926.1.p1 GENE.GEMP01070926.1~~GEMP01070926.1.p1  ORF type:complete len:218 (+),score=40.06 GEMP01070926.1:132-785(+)
MPSAPERCSAYSNACSKDAVACTMNTNADDAVVTCEGGVPPGSPGADDAPPYTTRDAVIGDYANTSKTAQESKRGRHESKRITQRMLANGFSYLQSVNEPAYLLPQDPEQLKGFPYYHPLSGLAGALAPGAQYPIHPPKQVKYPKNIVRSTYFQSYRRRVGGARGVDQLNPLTLGDSGTGYRFAIGTMGSLGNDSVEFESTYTAQQASGYRRTPRFE